MSHLLELAPGQLSERHRLALSDGTWLTLDASPDCKSEDGVRVRVTRWYGPEHPGNCQIIGYLDRLAPGEWLPLFSKLGGRLNQLANGPLSETRKQAALWLANRDEKAKGAQK